MKFSINKSKDRGYFDHSWLKTYHSYSFGEYYNPDRNGFGKLNVFNDEHIEPGYGFGFHPHRNIEIITIPLNGSVHYKDNFGNNQTINAGDVQILSAGTGIYHSEFNASETEPLNLLQIWIIPDKTNIRPTCDIKSYSIDSLKNKFRLIASPYKMEESLFINQDAYVYLTDIDKNYRIEFLLNNPKNGVFVFIIDGTVTFEKNIINNRDALEISETKSVKLYANSDSRLLFIEVPV